MLDLLGYWLSVTLILTPPFTVVVLLLSFVIGYEVKLLTEGKKEFKPFKKVFKSLDKNPALYTILIIYFVVDLAFLLGGGIATNIVGDTLVQFVSKSAMYITPVMSWLSLPVIIYAVHVLFIRKAIKSFLKLQEKLEKL